jgi:predicted nucleic acid-binding protein
MSAERFLDTNILLYAYDLDAGAKRETALGLVEAAWLKAGGAAISVQVLQEFHVNFLRSGRSRSESAAVLADFCLWPVVENTVALFQLGLSLQDRWQLSTWDAMILAAAHTCGARELITEDFTHGQDYGGVCAINPFLP